MKIYLCDLVHNQVSGDNQISGGSDFVVPLGIASIASYIQKFYPNPIDVSIYKYADDLLSAVEQSPPDVLAFSNYYWAKDLNFRIGSSIRKRHPEILTVMGGPSIRTEPQGITDFLHHNTFIDVYIMFEGERPFVQLLETFEDGGKSFLDKDTHLPGCAYLNGDQLIYREANLNETVDEFPSPYLNGMLDPFLEKGLIPLFETNRGCPYECTFCAWGIAAFNKVRRFPIERVYAEMDYVSSNFPAAPSWIIADGNFGILPRDVDIANRIKDIRTKTPELKHILTWESKNTSERNFKISEVMGNDVGAVLMAVQTLDSTAQEYVKRDNINLEDVPAKIDRFHATGAMVETHVLSGLPGESYQGHLETLRKCFQFGFDDLFVFSTLLLPGSEMETPQSRNSNDIRTRYRLRQGGYGEYSGGRSTQGVKSIDAEEIIRENSWITEEEMLSLRPLHWLIWYGWNHRFLKPLLKYIANEHGINPVDMMLAVADPDNHKKYPKLAELFAEFAQDAESEWFDSFQSLYEFYTTKDQWDDLIHNGFSKAEFKYNAIMILNDDLFEDLLQLIVTLVEDRFESSKASSFIPILQSMRIAPESLTNGVFAAEQQLEIPSDIGPYILGHGKENGKESDVHLLTLSKSLPLQKETAKQLLKHGYHDNKVYAVEKTLGALDDPFLYAPSVKD